ncbi:protein kinase [Candidatus Zixiibacteriota bacterium]
MDDTGSHREELNVTRRLVGVMFTDILGYSAKSSQDELRALKLVHEHNQMLMPLIEEHRGEVVKTIGDAIMGRFNSVIRAVECAVAMQETLKEFNADRDEHDQLLIRIGVHAGDVFETGGKDLFGHDVNIAARLEPLAVPGTVVATETVYILAQGKTNLHFRFLGEFPVKNIEHPLRVYQVSEEEINIPAEEIVHEKKQDLTTTATREAQKKFGHYTLKEQIGAGGMGEVWLAEDQMLERNVAIKLLPRHSAAKEEDRIRFIREAKAAAQLDHPNITQVYEIGEEEGELFIAMAHIGGGSLKERLDTLEGGTLPLADILDWSVQAAEGLAEAHRNGVVHRDIKPDNLMLSESGVVKITDFGLARLEKSTNLTAEGATLGTVNYMSPEQALGDEVDHRTDLFSLGAMMYELVSGRPPFDGPDASAVFYSILHREPEPVARLRSDIEPALERVILKLLQKEAKSRYQSADEVVADLRLLMAGDPSAVSVSRRSFVRMRTIPGGTTRKKQMAVIPALLAVVIIVAVSGGNSSRPGAVHLQWGSAFNTWVVRGDSTSLTRLESVRDDYAGRMGRGRDWISQLGVLGINSAVTGGSDDRARMDSLIQDNARGIYSEINAFSRDPLLVEALTRLGTVSAQPGRPDPGGILGQAPDGSIMIQGLSSPSRAIQALGERSGGSLSLLIRAAQLDGVTGLLESVGGLQTTEPVSMAGTDFLITKNFWHGDVSSILSIPAEPDSSDVVRYGTTDLGVVVSVDAMEALAHLGRIDHIAVHPDGDSWFWVTNTGRAGVVKDTRSSNYQLTLHPLLLATLQRRTMSILQKRADLQTSQLPESQYSDINSDLMLEDSIWYHSPHALYYSPEESNSSLFTVALLEVNIQNFSLESVTIRKIIFELTDEGVRLYPTSENLSHAALIATRADQLSLAREYLNTAIELEESVERQLELQKQLDDLSEAW